MKEHVKRLGEFMKRDMQLIRKILLAMEAPERWMAVKKEYTEAQIGFPCLPRAIGDAGFLEVVDVSGFSDGSMKNAHPVSMKWAGYDFLAASRDDALWNKVIKTGGDMAVDTIKGVLIDLGKEFLTATVRAAMQ